MLARAGAEVTLIGRPAHVEVWKREGLHIDSVNFQARIPVSASTDLDDCRHADLVLLCVKTLDTVQTARAVRRASVPGLSSSVFRTASTTSSA